MSATTTPTAKPRFWSRRRVVAWAVITVLLAICVSALRDRLRTEQTVAVIEQVDRLGGHVSLRREHADWQGWLARRLPLLEGILGHDAVSVGLPKAAPSFDDLRAVVGLPGLRTLDLTDATGIDDRALGIIGGTSGLIHLNLTGTDVTDQGIQGLVGRVFLNDIQLDDTHVTDAGVAALVGRSAVVKAISVRGANVNAVSGEGITVTKPTRSGGPITVAGRVFIRDLPPSGRAILTAMIVRPGHRDGQDVARMTLNPHSGWQEFTLTGTVPVREPEGRFAIEVNVYVGGPPFVIYRVARLEVEVLPTADPPTQE
ncbi:MAG: hypothetical protein U0746_05035 [Gemmataceae bacterium]